MLSTNKKEIFERIAEVQQEVLLGDVVKILRALNEDIDDIIEVISWSLCLHYNDGANFCSTCMGKTVSSKDVTKEAL